ncbi:hypothetical protein BJI48_00650 [Helicobacter sp. 11S02596-1]|nr:hypothetical protein BJI48_00650 [Helicobacter sp. 11S02596-1]
MLVSPCEKSAVTLLQPSLRFFTAHKQRQRQGGSEFQTLDGFKILSAHKPSPLRPVISPTKGACSGFLTHPPDCCKGAGDASQVEPAPCIDKKIKNKAGWV